MSRGFKHQLFVIAVVWLASWGGASLFKLLFAPAYLIIYSLGAAAVLVVTMPSLVQCVALLDTMIFTPKPQILVQYQVRQFSERVTKITDFDELILFLGDQIPILFSAELTRFYVLDDMGRYVDVRAQNEDGRLPDNRSGSDLLITSILSAGSSFSCSVPSEESRCELIGLLESVGAHLALPLIKNNVLEGLFLLGKPAFGDFLGRELAIADGLSFQIVSALTSAKYGRFLGQNLSHLSALTVFSKMVRNAMGVTQLFKTVELFLASHIGVTSQLFFVKSKQGLHLVDTANAFAHIRNTEFRISSEELDPLSAETPYLTAFNFIIRPEVIAPLQLLFREKFGQFESRELKFVPLVYQHEIIGAIWFCLRDSTAINRSLLYAVTPDIAATLRNIQMYRHVSDQHFLGKQTIDSIKDGIIVIDERRQIVQFNKAADALLGLRQIQTESLTMTYLEQQIPGIRDQFSRPSGQKQSGTELVLLRHGGNRPIRVSISSMMVYPGNRVGWMLHIADLTHIHAMTRQMAQSRRFSIMGRLAASLAREIQIPLSMIQLSARQMEGSWQNSEFRIRYAKSALFQVERLEKLNQSLVMLGQQVKPKLLPIRIGQVIEEVLNVLENELNQKQIEVHYNRNHVMSVMGDPSQLTHVFFNLIMNSINALPLSLPNRTISISVNESESMKVTISDTGTGIPDELMPHLFDPFYQARKAGAGLGLSIVQSIMEAHGGSLSIESGRGRGTTATLLLPVSRPKVYTVKVKSGATTSVLG